MILHDESWQSRHLFDVRIDALSTQDVLVYRDVRFGSGGYAEHPNVAPLSDADFSGLPPTIVVTAQCDPLSSDGEAYRDRIQAAGGRAAWREEPGLVHSFLRARHSAQRARQAFDRIVGGARLLRPRPLRLPDRRKLARAGRRQRHHRAHNR